MWYLQFHFECDKLFVSVILTIPPCVLCFGWRTISIVSQGGILVSKDFLFHHLRWWFVFAKATNKKPLFD